MPAGPVRLARGATSSGEIDDISHKKPHSCPAEKSRSSISRPVLNANYASDNSYLASEDYATQPVSILELGQPPFKVEQTYDQDVSGLSTFAVTQLDTDEAELNDEEGMPTRAQWDSIMNKYLNGLHHRKRDKALISKSMHEMIYQTLRDPDATRLGTPQFRFWARKMFQLVEASGVLVITSGGRPVAVKEHIYDILCMCHAESGHAGRDKTCKVLRDYYTWIPKELTASFVKACPTCTQKRTGEMAMMSRMVKQGKASLDESSTQKFRIVKHILPYVSLKMSEAPGVKSDTGNNEHSVYRPIAPPSRALQSDTFQRARFTGVRNAAILNDPLSSSSSYTCLSGAARYGAGPNSVLPPLNNNSMPEDIIDHEIGKHNHVSLSPLLQYLSVGVKTESQSPNISVGATLTSSSAVPIDPVLLNEEARQNMYPSSESNDSPPPTRNASAIPSPEQEIGARGESPQIGTSSILTEIDKSFEATTCNDKSLSSSSSTSSAAVCTPNGNRAWTSSGHTIIVDTCCEKSEPRLHGAQFILKLGNPAPALSP